MQQRIVPEQEQFFQTREVKQEQLRVYETLRLSQQPMGAGTVRAYTPIHADPRYTEYIDLVSSDDGDNRQQKEQQQQGVGSSKANGGSGGRGKR